MSRSLPIFLIIAAVFVLSTSSKSFSQQHVNENGPALVSAGPTESNDQQQKPHYQRGKSIQKHRVADRELTAKAAAPNKMHRVVIQISQNDPMLMTIALNNAQNLTDYYQQKGESVQVEVVAYGPGLRMLRADTSPVSDRIKSFVEKNKYVTFSACGNTLNAQSKQENTQIMLLPEARIVPAGIARITELEEQGWTYVRP
jgi:intracellular sulfur oxidation DsrE/DsrF family protein